MLLKFLLMFAAAFALFWTIRNNKTFPAIITVGMIVGIILTLFMPRTLQFYGIYVYMGFVALSFIYSLIIKEKEILTRIIIGIMAVSIFVYWLWVMNHWHGNEVLAPIVTLLAGVVAVFNIAKLKNELGFLVILAVDAIAIIIEHLMKAN